MKTINHTIDKELLKPLGTKFDENYDNTISEVKTNKLIKRKWFRALFTIGKKYDSDVLARIINHILPHNRFKIIKGNTSEDKAETVLNSKCKPLELHVSNNDDEVIVLAIRVYSLSKTEVLNYANSKEDLTNAAKRLTAEKYENDLQNRVLPAKDFASFEMLEDIKLFDFYNSLK